MKLFRNISGAADESRHQTGRNNSGAQNCPEQSKTRANKGSLFKTNKQVIAKNFLNILLCLSIRNTVKVTSLKIGTEF